MGDNSTIEVSGWGHPIGKVPAAEAGQRKPEPENSPGRSPQCRHTHSSCKVKTKELKGLANPSAEKEVK